MCTVTIIELRLDADAAPSGYRLVTNRDERRDRPQARPPREHPLPWGKALWPIDGLAGGTWVGASNRGLTLALLNSALPAPPTPPAPDELLSRGVIIPQLLDAAGAEEAVTRLTDLPLHRFMPFGLIGVDLGGVWSASWDGREAEMWAAPLGPICHVSSGLGDHLAAPRIELFEHWVRERGATPVVQDAFHRHQWPERPEISVLMSRVDARTVSTTSVEVFGPAAAPQVGMTYSDDAGARSISLAGSGVLSGVGNR